MRRFETTDFACYDKAKYWTSEDYVQEQDAKAIAVARFQEEIAKWEQKAISSHREKVDLLYHKDQERAMMHGT